MGGMLGGGGGGGGGGAGGGGGFLGNLLGGLPDPLGLGKMLGITGGNEHQGPPGGGPPPGPPGLPPVQFNGGPPASGVAPGLGQALNSPMSPTGFGIGGGGRR